MKRTVSLFEFMPYGAPELLDAGRSHLARALAATSLLALAAFLAALPLSPLLRPAGEPVADLTRVIIEKWPAPKYVEPRAPTARIPVSRAPKIGAIVPVPPIDAPPIDDPPGTGAGTGAPGIEGVARGEPESRGTEGGDEPLPVRGEFRYVDEPPVPVTQIKPDYPALPREAGIEGLVAVDVLVGKDGRVMRAEIVREHSIVMLDEAALEASRRWVFSPAIDHGRPVACWYRIPFRFVLHE
jgi:protein TonB